MRCMTWRAVPARPSLGDVPAARATCRAWRAVHPMRRAAIYGTGPGTDMYSENPHTGVRMVAVEVLAVAGAPRCRLGLTQYVPNFWQCLTNFQHK